jgi:hypothetical protein
MVTMKLASYCIYIYVSEGQHESIETDAMNEQHKAPNN